MTLEILLGYIDEEVTSESSLDPFTSRLGGLPIWLDSSLPLVTMEIIDESSSVSRKEKTQLKGSCPGCQASLFLVAQVDVTLELSSFHRVLYVFGCPNPQCQTNPKAWKVIRGQTRKSRLPLQSPQKETSKVTAAAADDWGVDAGNWGNDDDDDKSDIGGGWGAGPLEDLSALEKALDQHEAHMDAEGGKKKKTKKDFTKDEVVKVNYLHDSRFAQSRFAAHYVCFENEPDPVVYKKTLSKHERELLERYEQEASAGTDNDFGGDGNEDDDYEDGNEHDPEEETDEGVEGQQPSVITKKRAMPPSPKKSPAKGKEPADKQRGVKGKGKNKAKMSEGTGGGGSGGEGWGGEEYEAYGIKHVEKTLWRFQKRLMISPAQVMRFPPYGDTPLYYTSDPRFSPPAPEKIPKCPCCGAVRKFEFQLMPNTLAFLKQSHPIPSASNSLPSTEGLTEEQLKIETARIMGTSEGMEWGTVLVYTCPKSCTEDEEAQAESTHMAQYFEEYIFVQPLS